jgi:hypothetical protein
VRRVFLACFLTFSCLLCATTVVPVSLEELTRNSSHVVEAIAAESWTRWNPQHTFIYTYTRFEVSAGLKGNPPSTLIVKQLGGSAEGYTQKVAGVRGWHPGEKAVLFLRPSADVDTSFEITGLMQGNFAVHTLSTGESIVSNGMPGASSHHASPDQAVAFHGSAMRLQELESRVRQAVER